MNRSTALLLALATLLAHILTLHQDAVGRFSPPLDSVHVALRLGREWVHGGGLSSLFTQADSYPSALWVALGAAAERLHSPPTTWVQGAAVLCALGAVWVLSRFSPARLAGVIAPMLCVLSGTIASAAGSGSEFAALTLWLIWAFLALEHGRSTFLAVALSAAVLTRPEGLLLAALFLILRLFGYRRPARPSGASPAADAPPLVSLWAFAPPLVLELAISLVRLATRGHLESHVLHGLFRPAEGQWSAGGSFVLDFLLHSGAPLLVAVPVLAALTGRLGGRAYRALAVALAWILYAALQGGSDLPFWAVLAPAIPLLFLAVQESLTQWIDERQGASRRVAWALFALGLVSSALASKQPGDLGPLPLAAVQRAWLGDHTPEPADPLVRPRVRAGSQAAVEEVVRLRALGAFLRDQLDPRATIASPWPGALSYLTRRPVHDLFGRSTVLSGATHRASGFGPKRTDLLAAFAADADYVVPFLLRTNAAPRVVPFVRTWFERYDTVGPSDERIAAFWSRIADYEWITVPVPALSGSTGPVEPVFLLRHRRLGLAPSLSASVEGRAVRVEVQHAGHLQLADLEVCVQDSAGQLHSLRPTGHYKEGRGVHARVNLLLQPTGERRVRLVDAPLPADLRPTHVFAVLRNPGSQGDTGYSLVSNEVALDLRP